MNETLHVPDWFIPVGGYGPYPALVTKIHDGDTFQPDLDLGFGIHAVEHRCRLYGINAPELNTPEGKLARDYLKSIMPVGAKVTIYSYGWDKYGGRFDGTVIYGLTNINQKMLETGHAKEMRL